MDKKNLIITSIATICVGAATIYVINKNKKVNNAAKNMINNLQMKVNKFTETDETIDNTNADNITETTNVLFDFEDNDSSENKTNIEWNKDILDFLKYLRKNGVDVNEALSICETIHFIYTELHDEYDKTVSKKMFDMMKTDFNVDESKKFDLDNFNLFYTSIDPCQLFIRNGFKILSMGPDCQDDMMQLADALVVLIDENPKEAAVVMYDIYHAFNDLDTDSITETTYNEKFKEYVDRYVTESTDNTENINEEGAKI